MPKSFFGGKFLTDNNAMFQFRRRGISPGAYVMK